MRIRISFQQILFSILYNITWIKNIFNPYKNVHELTICKLLILNLYNLKARFIYEEIEFYV